MSRDLFVVGLSHHTTELATRERAAVADEQLSEVLASLAGQSGVEELVMLSTCNRVEFYAAGDAQHGTAALRAWFEKKIGLGSTKELYVHSGRDALDHAYRVASSLDSMVVGEPQILGQLKQSFGIAEQEKTVGPLLHRAFHRAFSVAKRVRNETQIGSGTVSIASLACDLARSVFQDLQGKRVLLVGAGEMGESAAKHLQKKGCEVYVMNRNLERAEKLALEVQGHARKLDELQDELVLADVVIASTSATDYLINEANLGPAIRKRKYRSLFLIDIAVPRNIDPKVAAFENVYLFDVDDLARVAEENLAQRQREAERAAVILDEEIDRFFQWMSSSELAPVLRDLRKQTERVVEQELERVLGSQLTPEVRERLVDGLTGKLLHAPIQALRKAADEGREDVLQFVQNELVSEGSIREHVRESIVPKPVASNASAPPKRNIA